MDNRLAAQLQVSRNWITFVEEGNPDDFPYDTVAVSIRPREFTARNFPIPETNGSMTSRRHSKIV